MCVDPVHTFLPAADSSGARVGMLCRRGRPWCMGCRSSCFCSSFQGAGRSGSCSKEEFSFCPMHPVTNATGRSHRQQHPLAAQAGCPMSFGGSQKSMWKDVF